MILISPTCSLHPLATPIADQTPSLVSPSALEGKFDSLEQVSYYAAFDGHAGTEAAAYAAAHHELLVESSAYPENPVQAFGEAFITCDEDLSKYSSHFADEHWRNQ